MAGETPEGATDSLSLSFLAGQSPEVRKRALDLLDSAVKELAAARKTREWNRDSSEAAAKNHITQLADQFALLIDPTYMPGRGGNDEDSTARRNGFYSSAITLRPSDMHLIKMQYDGGKKKGWGW